MVSSIVLMTVLTAGAPPILTSAPAKFQGLGRQSRSCGRSARRCNSGCGTAVSYTQPCCGSVSYGAANCCTPAAVVSYATPAPVVSCATPVVHSAPVVTYAAPVLSGCAGGSCGGAVFYPSTTFMGGFRGGCGGGRCR